MGDPEQEEPHEPGDGFVRLASAETIDRVQAELRASLPRPDIPPMANVRLLRELLLGEGAERLVQVRDTTYRVPPLGYLDGLTLTRLAQDLDHHLTAERVLDHMRALRAVYVTLAAQFKRVVFPLTRKRWRAADEPFVDLTAQEFREMVIWLLGDGNEVPVPPPTPRPDAVYKAYDAASTLLGYLTTVGHLPGWTIPPGLPTSWRHYCAVRDYLIRTEASQQMSAYLSSVMPQVTDKDLRTRFVEDIRRRGGG